MPKIRLYLLFLLPLFLGFSASHPFYLSVTTLVYKPQEQQMQVTVRLFANDFEKSLRKTSGKAVDLYNASDKSALEANIKSYINACVTVAINGKQLPLQFLGHELEDESCFIYLQGNNCGFPQKLDVSNKLLYDSFTEQSNIVQAELGDKSQSARVNYPNTSITFQFPLGNQ